MRYLILILLFGCVKSKTLPKQTYTEIKAPYAGTWWSDLKRDSLVISASMVKFDSVYYHASMPEFERQLTHKVNFEPNDDNLILRDNGTEYSFRRDH